MTLEQELAAARAHLSKVAFRPLDTALDAHLYRLCQWLVDTLGGATPCGWDEVSWRRAGRDRLVVVQQQIDLDVQLTPDEARWMASSLLRAADNAEAG